MENYKVTKKMEKEIPIVSKVLKQLTPERIAKEIKDMKRIELSPVLEKCIKEYEKVGVRNRYLWIWAHKSVPLITFPFVHSMNIGHLYENKLLMVMFVTVLDDIADNFKNKKMLEQAIKIPFQTKNVNLSFLKQEENSYLDFALKLWKKIINHIQDWSNYKKFRDLFEFDSKQILNAMEYSYLLSRNPKVINTLEHWNYFSHNLPIVLSLTFDLMFTSSVGYNQLGLLREIAWHVQKMGQGMNWVSTWEREIEEDDFTSGVFAYAIRLGILESKDLNMKNKNNVILKIKKARIEENILFEVESELQKILYLGKQINLFSIKRYFSNLEKFIFLQVLSRGHY